MKLMSGTQNFCMLILHIFHDVGVALSTDVTRPCAAKGRVIKGPADHRSKAVDGPARQENAK